MQVIPGVLRLPSQGEAFAVTTQVFGARIFHQIKARVLLEKISHAKARPGCCYADLPALIMERFIAGLAAEDFTRE
jgi:hypothetical protein